MGTNTKSEDGDQLTSGVGITLGIVASVNLIAYLGFRQYKKYFKSNKYTKLDVDFTKFTDKLNELREKENEILIRLHREQALNNRKCYCN